MTEAGKRLLAAAKEMRETAGSEGASALPEKFEVFEQSMLADEKPKRRRSTPAAKPKDMPEAEKKKRLTAADVPGVGGMVEKRWAGKPMWECPKCLATTFNAGQAKVHVCKQVKYADEEGLAD